MYTTFILDVINQDESLPSTNIYILVVFVFNIFCFIGEVLCFVIFIVVRSLVIDDNI